jgi:hypothetical protein
MPIGILPMPIGTPPIPIGIPPIPIGIPPIPIGIDIGGSIGGGGALPDMGIAIVSPSPPENIVFGLNLFPRELLIANSRSA